jgi:hypothetical protein
MNCVAHIDGTQGWCMKAVSQDIRLGPYVSLSLCDEHLRMLISRVDAVYTGIGVQIQQSADAQASVLRVLAAQATRKIPDLNEP